MNVPGDEHDAALCRRILFLGNPYHPLSVACLAALIEAAPEVIVGMPTGSGGLRRQIRRASGAGDVLSKAGVLVRAKLRLVLRRAGLPLRGYRSLEEICLALGVTTIPMRTPNGPRFIATTRELGIDLAVLANFGTILKEPFISTPPLGCINVHLSLLPAYRGPFPIHWAVANGERRVGVTVYRVDAGIDSGPILLQRAIEVTAGASVRSIEAASHATAAELVRESIALIRSGQARYTPQDAGLASYYSKRPTRRSGYAGAISRE